MCCILRRGGWNYSILLNFHCSDRTEQKPLPDKMAVQNILATLLLHLDVFRFFLDCVMHRNNHYYTHCTALDQVPNKEISNSVWLLFTSEHATDFIMKNHPPRGWPLSIYYISLINMGGLGWLLSAAGRPVLLLSMFHISHTVKNTPACPFNQLLQHM